MYSFQIVQKSSVLPELNGYVEIENDYFSIRLNNQSAHPAAAEINLNGVSVGTFLVEPMGIAFIHNPDPAYGSGRFKAVKDQNGVAGVGEINLHDQGVVSISFIPGYKPVPSQPLYKGPYFLEHGAPYTYSYSSELQRSSSVKSRNISSRTHENADIALEGNSIQSFEAVDFIPDSSKAPVVKEVRLVIKKNTIRVLRPVSTFRPPSL